MKDLIRKILIEEEDSDWDFMDDLEPFQENSVILFPNGITSITKKQYRHLLNLLGTLIPDGNFSTWVDDYRDMESYHDLVIFVQPRDEDPLTRSDIDYYYGVEKKKGWVEYDIKDILP